MLLDPVIKLWDKRTPGGEKVVRTFHCSHSEEAQKRNDMKLLRSCPFPGDKSRAEVEEQ